METKKIIIIAGSTIVGAGIFYVALNFDKVKNKIVYGIPMKYTDKWGDASCEEMNEFIRTHSMRKYIKAPETKKEIDAVDELRNLKGCSF